MKILSYTEDGDMIRIVTDNPDRPEFVYFADKFGSIEALEAEINKSIALENKKKDKKASKLTKLKSDLDKKVK